MSRALVLAILCTLAIFVGCLLPGQGLPPVDAMGIDKVVHVVMFVAFGWLWMRALPQPLPVRAGWVVATGLFYAVLIEVAQYASPSRSAEVYDVVADLIGLFVAVAVFWVWHRAKEKTDVYS